MRGGQRVQAGDSPVAVAMAALAGSGVAGPMTPAPRWRTAGRRVEPTAAAGEPWKAAAQQGNRHSAAVRLDAAIGLAARTMWSRRLRDLADYSQVPIADGRRSASSEAERLRWGSFPLF